MSKNIYFTQNGKHPPNRDTHHVGTPFRVINEFEGKIACEYQLEYLDMWQNWFCKALNNTNVDLTADWFESVGILRRQAGFHGPHGNKYTCEEVFIDCRNKCKDYLKNTSRYSYLPTPCFDKVERAIAKGIEVIVKRNSPYVDISDKLWATQEAAQIVWIEGKRPATGFNKHFDVDSTVKAHYEEAS